VLVEEIDAFGFEPFERFLGNLADMLRSTVQTRRLSVLNIGPELRGNDHLFAERKKRFAHQFFVDERTVDFCGALTGVSHYDLALFLARHHLDCRGACTGADHRAEVWAAMVLRR